MKPDLTLSETQALAYELFEDPQVVHLLFGGGAGSGKRLSVNTLIPTPKGFKYNGDLKDGDIVFAPDGTQTKILKAHPIEIGNSYRVFFDDGTCIECDAEHLWYVEFNGKGSVKTTLEIKESKETYSIPNTKPIECEEWKDSANPYMVGLVNRGGGEIHPYFLRGSIEQREEILSGLMKKLPGEKAIRGEFHSGSYRAFENFRELLASLGIKSHNNRGSITFDREEENADRRFITSIEKIDDIEMRCITVEHPSHMYLCGRQMVPTHNTFILGLLLALACKKYPNTRWGLARKELKSLKQTTLATLLAKVHPALGITESDYRMNLLESTLEYVNGSQVLLLDLTAKPSDPEMESLGSLELTGAFIDEAGEVTKKAYDILASRVNRWMNEEYGITGKITSSCVPAGDLVQTKNGYKHVENVTYEDSLLTDDGSYSPVLQIFERDANEKLYSIYYTDNNLPLRLTSKHPVLVSTPTRSVKTWYENGKQKKQRIVEHNFEYRTPDKISIGDWVRVPRITEYTEIKYLWPEVKYAKKYIGTKAYKTAKYRAKMSSPLNDENFWWLVGYWLGDGWATGDKIYFACGNKYPEIKQRVDSAIKNLGRKTQFKEQAGCELLSFSSAEVAKFLRTFGHGAKNKSIPNDILHSRFGTQIVSGFIDSDGCVMSTKGKSVIEFVSINNNLLMQIQQIMFKHGIIGSLKNKRVAEFVEFRDTRYAQQPRFHLYYGFYDTKLFYNISNSVKLKSKFITSEPIKRNKANAYADEKFIYFKIKKIDTLDYTGKVYNFETAPHNYVAGNAVVHNCNPTPGFVRQEFYDKYDALGGGRMQKWKTGKVWVNGEQLDAYSAYVRSTALDNPFISRNYIEQLRRLPPQEKKRLLDGDWNYTDEDDSLFPMKLIDKMTVYEMPEPELTPKGEEKFNKFIGVDPSDSGKDDTVATLIENGVIREQVEIKSPEGKDAVISMFIAGKVIEFAEKHGFTAPLARNITIEGNGIGAALRDSLKTLGWNVNVYTATLQSRSAGYYEFMTDANDDKIKIWHEVVEKGLLVRQLSAHKYDLDTGKPRITNKKALRTALGRSPDHADSAMIAAMAYRSKPKAVSSYIRW